jgi:hypothetical protein
VSGPWVRVHEATPTGEERRSVLLNLAGVDFIKANEIEPGAEVFFRGDRPYLTVTEPLAWFADVLINKAEGL